MRLRIRKVKLTPVLEVSGEVTCKNINKITSKLNALRKGDSKMIAIDLNRTTFIDSSGLGALVYIWRILEEEHRHLVIFNPLDSIRDIFEDTSLNRLFKYIKVDELI
ncbi:MAG: STAS domain-containing protein [Fibrobacter sp.]|nr:STAS domain-containing protein [Fibrobacter sp.]